jgi:hypothetical protein
MVEQVLLMHMAQLEPWPRAAHDLHRHQVQRVVLLHLAQLQLWPKVAHDSHPHDMQQALLVQMGVHQSMLHVFVPVLWLVLLLQVWPLSAKKATRMWLVGLLRLWQLVP